MGVILDDIVQHGTAVLGPDVRIHYISAGSGSRTMVLLHGYPQTWWEWRHLLRPLVEAGWRVVAPDYRGAGSSSKPPEGYDKRTMAADIRAVLTDHLGIHGPVTMVGHDIGLMVAYAYASQYPKSVERLVLMEAPVPGTLTYDAMLAITHLRHALHWHFFFHNAGDNMAEALTAGRERVYLQNFYNRLAINQSGIHVEDLDHYVASYAATGGMRAGFELYRAFDRDAEDNKAALKKNGRLTMPVLGIGGAGSFFVSMAKPMLKEIAKDTNVVSIANCGHWIAEEQPEALLRELLFFTQPGK